MHRGQNKKADNVQLRGPKKLSLTLSVFVCFPKIDFFAFFLSLQDSVCALAHDLNYPALRKNKNIDAFLNRCKSPSM